MQDIKDDIYYPGDDVPDDPPLSVPNPNVVYMPPTADWSHWSVVLPVAALGLWVLKDVSHHYLLRFPAAYHHVDNLHAIEQEALRAGESIPAALATFEEAWEQCKTGEVPDFAALRAHDLPALFQSLVAMPLPRPEAISTVYDNFVLAQSGALDYAKTRLYDNPDVTSKVLRALAVALEVGYGAADQELENIIFELRTRARAIELWEISLSVLKSVTDKAVTLLVGLGLMSEEDARAGSGLSFPADPADVQTSFTWRTEAAVSLLMDESLVNSNEAQLSSSLSGAGALNLAPAAASCSLAISKVTDVISFVNEYLQIKAGKVDCLLNRRGEMAKELDGAIRAEEAAFCAAAIMDLKRRTDIDRAQRAKACLEDTDAKDVKDAAYQEIKKGIMTSLNSVLVNVAGSGVGYVEARSGERGWLISSSNCRGSGSVDFAREAERILKSSLDENLKMDLIHRAKAAAVVAATSERHRREDRERDAINKLRQEAGEKIRAETALRLAANATADATYNAHIAIFNEARSTSQRDFCTGVSMGTAFAMFAASAGMISRDVGRFWMRHVASLLPKCNPLQKISSSTDDSLGATLLTALSVLNKMNIFPWFSALYCSAHWFCVLLISLLLVRFAIAPITLLHQIASFLPGTVFIISLLYIYNRELYALLHAAPFMILIFSIFVLNGLLLFVALRSVGRKPAKKEIFEHELARLRAVTKLDNTELAAAAQPSPANNLLRAIWCLSTLAVGGVGGVWAARVYT